MNLTSRLRSNLLRSIAERWLLSSCVQQHQFAYVRLEFRTMSSFKCKRNQSSRSYEDALKTLNELQSNLSAFTMAASQVHQSANTSKADAQRYLLKSGISMDQLDTLSVVHVSGTKGKGSTCALVESILRATGVRTGFYSSPHLVDVTERFRLDGRPISREKFAEYFWRVYDALDSSKEHELDMPAYFKILTVVAFHIFLDEKVDVAILEVGIGGEHDCTNIVRNTKTAGITALGLDHTQLLGNQLPDIAWQKSGIIKNHCNVFTSNQPLECRETLQSRAAAKNANLLWVPELSRYNWGNTPLINLSPAHRLNGSLAIQLAYDWVKNNGTIIRKSKMTEELVRSSGMCLEIFDEVRTGIEQCNWPGRFQKTRLGSKNLYIDGSHTAESLKICIDWFVNQTQRRPRDNYLIFNVTGGRDVSRMLSMLHAADCFGMVAFVPNVAHSSRSSDDTSLESQKRNATIWKQLELERGNNSKTKVFASVEDVFHYLDRGVMEQSSTEINVLVTGSLYLVGAVTELLNEHIIK